MTQAAGRAGRGEVLGEVIVQTYTPHHPAIQAARRLDFDGFYAAFTKKLLPRMRRAGYVAEGPETFAPDIADVDAFLAAPTP